jgi:hypothetical protein
MARYALKDRRVFTVDWDELSTAVFGCFFHELTGDHQRLLVRQSDALSGFECRQRGVQSRRADDRIDDDVDVVTSGCLDERVTAALPRLAGIARFHHSNKRWRKLPGLLFQQRRIAVGGKRRDAETLTLPVQYAKGRGPDRPGGTEDGDALRLSGRAHCGTGRSNLPSTRYAIGSTKGSNAHTGGR